jgi:hypothetical protein
MNCKVIYGGFNPVWQAGRLERQLIDELATRLEQQLPNINKVLAVTSWHEPASLVNQISSFNPDVTFLCSLTDPLGPIENLIEQISGQTELVGYVDGKFFYDFWAVACDKFFKKYHNKDLEPNNLTNVFLNYNRKPHRHRTELVKMLQEKDLVKFGCVTLGNSSYIVDENLDEYAEYGANDVVGDVGIPNDIYSLGQLDIWNSSLINIVSETQYEFSKNVFISEKIFKPIIGLRPFIINGSPGIYRILKKAGFDCFDDLFPVAKLENEILAVGEFKFKNHELICQTVANYKQTDLLQLYHYLKPRLLYNQNLFYEYARNQKLHFDFVAS